MKEEGQCGKKKKKKKNQCMLIHSLLVAYMVTGA